MKATLVFNGASRVLKGYLAGFGAGTPGGLAFVAQCHDVGVNDQQVKDGEDVYGHLCKCPPGTYIVGRPQHLNPPEPAYGRAFIPLSDGPDQAFAKHGRDGIGIHGGGSDLPDPFAPYQGWEWTYGCLRLQNSALEGVVVPFVEQALARGVTPTLAVVWP
jgi:hypothetical protein